MNIIFNLWNKVVKLSNKKCIKSNGVIHKGLRVKDTIK